MKRFQAKIAAAWACALCALIVPVSCDIFSGADVKVSRAAAADAPVVGEEIPGTIEGSGSNASLGFTYQISGAPERAARSAAGRTSATESINVMQMILINAADSSYIGDFDEDRVTLHYSGNANLSVSGSVVEGQTYYVMLLLGNSATAFSDYATDLSNDVPTLLKTGFAKLVPQSGGKVQITLHDVFLDTQFVNAGGGINPRYPGRLAKTVGIDSDSNRMRVLFGNTLTGMRDAKEDPLKVAGGDGLDDLRAAKYALTNTGSTYVTGAGDVTFASANLVQAGATGASATPVTIGTGADGFIGGVSFYDFTIPVPAANYPASFNYEFIYRPFNYDPSTSAGASDGNTVNEWLSWPYFTQATKTSGEGTMRANGIRWVIRNGLNNTAMAASGYTGGDGKGSIPVALVVSPATPPTFGIYEDGNPYSIQGTGMTGYAGDLKRALDYLTGKGAGGNYGHYEIRLAASEENANLTAMGTLPVNFSTAYAAIKHTAITISGTANITLRTNGSALFSNVETSANTLTFAQNVTLAGALVRKNIAETLFYVTNPNAHFNFPRANAACLVYADNLESTVPNGESLDDFNGASNLPYTVESVSWAIDRTGATPPSWTSVTPTLNTTTFSAERKYKVQITLKGKNADTDLPTPAQLGTTALGTAGSAVTSPGADFVFGTALEGVTDLTYTADSDSAANTSHELTVVYTFTTGSGTFQ